MNIDSLPFAMTETLLSNSLAGILVYEGDSGNCVFANQAVAEMLGGSIAALRLQNFGALASWRGAGLDELAEAALQDGLSRHHEVTLDIALGKTVSLDCFISRFDFEGQPHLTFIVADITERKQAQEKLARERALLRCLIDSVSDLIFIKDRDGIYRGCNKAGEAFIGMPECEQIGKTDLDFFDRDKAEQIRKADRRVFEDGKPLRIEEWVTGRDGRRRLMDTLKAPYYDSAGEALGLVGIGRDITERKRAEEALRESEKKLREAARIAHVGYWERDYVAQTIVLSEEACKIFGLPPHHSLPELTEWHEQWVKLIHPEDQKQAAQAAADALAGGPPYNVNYRVVRSDGQVRYVHSYAEVTRDASGSPLRMFGTMIDITEQKRMEMELAGYREHLEEQVKERTAELEERQEQIIKLNQDLRNRAAALEAANKELDAFVYSVSHDLRAPVRHIDGFMDLLRKRAGEALDEQSRHYMGTISDAADRMGRLFDDLLTFSRMGRQSMSLKQVDLGPLVRDVVRELELEAAGRNIVWRIGDLPAVKGDASMLRIVLSNLISNAVKFTRSNNQARIEVGCQSREEERIIFVRDNGVGFDPAYVGKLFGVFKRLHHKDEFEGTGVGLAIVQRIIIRHGGRTWAEAQVGHGATFYFSLPWFDKGKH
jgi:PAS domain S-box-containing protein